MDRIRLFYSNMDVKPKILINHFSRYLGFYVEDVVGNTRESEIESLIDIYIYSEVYVKSATDFFRVRNREKAIIIYMGQWFPDGLDDIRNIRYDGLTDEQFLGQLWECMFPILFTRADIFGRLVGSAEDVKVKVNEFIKIYIKYNILQMSVFTRCSPAHRDMFKSSYFRYRFFIGRIEKLMERLDDSLIRYMRLLACYEIDMICKVNSYKPYRSPMLLQEECGLLLREYGDNEELHIIQADISLHLHGAWKKAGNEFSDKRLSECAYAYLRRGNILRNYVRDCEVALNAYKSAVERKEDYFIAWFQMGECAREMMEYRRAVEAYDQVAVILREKYQAHILSPLEITYLFKAFWEKAKIYKLKLRDEKAAEVHFRMARSIWQEVETEGYFKLLWDDERAMERFFPLIKKKLLAELEEYRGKMRAEENGYYEYRRG